MTDEEKKVRLAEIAERMKTAKGAELDKLVAEVDEVVGLSEPEAIPEFDLEWEESRA